MRWLWLFVAGCLEPHRGIQIGAEGTPPGTAGRPVPGGIELWFAGGTTGLPPVKLAAEGGSTCGRDGDLLDLDLDGVVDIAFSCAYPPPTALRGAGTQTTGSVTTTPDPPELDTLIVWSGAEALGGQAVEIAPRRQVPTSSWVVAVPDVDGDGVTDLSVAPPWPYGSTQDWTVVLSGADLAGPGFVLGGDHLWYPLDRTGLRAGDFDGDGVGDLLVAAWASFSGDDNRIYVVSGAAVPSAATVDDAALALWTSSAEHERLRAAEPVGDLDGDAVPDVVSVTDEGKVRVLFGGTGGGPMGAAPWLSGLALGSEGSVQATGLGDLDGDGRGELALSVRPVDEETRVAVIPGGLVPSVGSVALDPFVIEASYESGGGLLACDVSGDGLADLITGRGWYDGATLLSAPTLVPLEPHLGSGRCAGDLDGDGRAEVMVPNLHL